MPTENLRSVLIIALCVVGFLLWQAWQKDYATSPEQALTPDSSTVENSGGGLGTPEALQVNTSSAALEAPSIPTETGAADIVEPGTLPVEGQVRVQTDVFDIVMTANAIHQLKLRDYPLTEDRPDIPFPLLNDSMPNIFVAESLLIGSNNEPDRNSMFTPRASTAVLADGKDELVVSFDYRGPEGIEVVKNYHFRRASYQIKVSYDITNNTGIPWSGRLGGFFRRTQVVDGGGLFRVYTYTGGVVSSPDKPYEKVDFEDMLDAPLSRNVTGGWAAMIQHYFAGAWIPDPSLSAHYVSEALPSAQYRLGLYYDSVLAPGERKQLGLTAFIGPKIQDSLNAAAPGLERTVDYGWLFFLAEPMFVVLKWIHGLVHNWGWTIIVFTILLKAAFFWLSATSYKSMARMRKLQPRIMALRDRHKEDKQRMNQEMMKLYKEEKINPLGGCLPILVQIPFFIALYWVLLESVELRQSPFIWWITDLAQKDPYYVLPLLMGASMYVQQKLNPAPPDPMQAKIMMALPFVFTIFFLGFPSGLVLYWFVNNLLSIAQQYVITKKIEAE